MENSVGTFRTDHLMQGDRPSQVTVNTGSTVYDLYIVHTISKELPGGWGVIRGRVCVRVWVGVWGVEVEVGVGVGVGVDVDVDVDVDVGVCIDIVLALYTTHNTIWHMFLW